MQINNITKYLIIIVSIFTSCSKSDEEIPKDPVPQPTPTGKYITTDNQSKIVTNLNGFRFEGGYTTSEPIMWPYLWLQHIEDYKDSTRVVILNQNKDKSMTTYMAANPFNGKTSRYFDHGTFPNNVSNSMSFRFNNKDFILNTIDKINGTFTERGKVFGFETQNSRPLNYLNNYRYELINKYIIRYISGISFWPQLASNGTDEPQFIATGELSDPKAVGHLIDENFSDFPHDIKSNMYSGFFQSTNEKTYIGFSKGGENLATLTLNNNPPNWYIANACNVYIDKDGDDLYLLALINLPNTAIQKRSLYKCNVKTNIITTLYVDKEMTHKIEVFSKGNFYGSGSDGVTHYKTDINNVQQTISVPDKT